MILSPQRVMVLQRSSDMKRPHSRASQETAQTAALVCKSLASHGVEVVSNPDDRASHDDLIEHNVDLIIVIGGDGTILFGSQIARELDVPLLGINTGHVGFLAEVEAEDVDKVIHQVIHGNIMIEERMTLDVEVRRPDGSVEFGWALNEAALDKRDRSRVVDVAIGVDGQAVSSFGCDGLIVSTPTGSTAYAFSCGGPILWPDLQALLLVPVAAHALFTRPLVVGPHSCLELGVAHSGGGGCDIWCDGRRSIDAPEGSLIRVRAGEQPVRLVRVTDAPFSERLVAKFHLPVDGWRAVADSED
nr:NAD kinase [Actinomyces vulturis]